MLKKLSQQCIQSICVSQVILDLPNCVKELVENSIDAGAKHISIYLKDFGQEEIIVTDDGNGINVEEFNRIVEKGATSKLNAFEDLNQLDTYGFRGEALNALNQLANLTVITRTSEDINHGWKIQFSRQDNSLSLKEPIKKEIGILNFFVCNEIPKEQQ